MTQPTAATTGGKVTASGYNQVVADLTDTGWIAATLQNSWVNFGAPYANPQYRLLNGFVVVEGLIKNGTLTAGTVLFTLPVGSRPLAQLRFACISSTSLAIVEVKATGDVIAGTAIPSASSVSLDSIRFIAEQ